MKRNVIKLDIKYSDISKIIDDKIIIHAIKKYLDSKKEYYYYSVELIESSHWMHWNDEEDKKNGTK